MLLAADFARLGEHVREAEHAGADRIHVDVMDGHFVRNISMGAPIVASLRPVTRLPLETHMMISDPDLFLQEFAEAGADSFLVHWEGNPKITRVRQMIDRLNPGCDPEGDGGIDRETAQLAVNAGANVLVAGSAVFGDSEGVAAGMKSLRANLGRVHQ